MESALLSLLAKTIEQFDDMRRNKPSLTARNSVPIIFSGNIAQYEKSPLKIVTVALNPSSNEFVDVNHRYKVERLDSKNLFEVCSAYFDVSDVREVSPWFKNYQKILLGANASYFKGHPSRAIHSDIVLADCYTAEMARFEKRRSAQPTRKRFAALEGIHSNPITRYYSYLSGERVSGRNLSKVVGAFDFIESN